MMVMMTSLVERDTAAVVTVCTSVMVMIEAMRVDGHIREQHVVVRMGTDKKVLHLRDCTCDTGLPKDEQQRNAQHCAPASSRLPAGRSHKRDVTQTATTRNSCDFDVQAWLPAVHQLLTGRTRTTALSNNRTWSLRASST